MSADFDKFVASFSRWNDDCWRTLYLMLSNNRVTLSEAHRRLAISPNTIRRRLNLLGLHLDLARGRPSSPANPDEIRRRLMQLRNQEGILCGYKHAAESVAHDAEPPAYKVVEEIFRQQGWMKSIKRKKVPQHRKRFEAKYVDYLWHTDIHELLPSPEGGHVYMIAFLDDLSRTIIHWKLIPDKTMRSTSQALQESLASGLKPAVITSDNGGEFRGCEFVTLLKSQEIQPFYTEPYTPQQNGKMERFWRTLDSARGNDQSEETIERIVHLYNYKWFCKPLGTTPGRFRELHLSWRANTIVIKPNISDNLIWNDEVRDAEYTRRAHPPRARQNIPLAQETKARKWEIVACPPVWVTFGDEESQPNVTELKGTGQS